MEEQTQTCIVCEQRKTQGMKVCDQFICADCEREIVTTDVTDERYQYFVDCMKKIWLSATS